MYITKAKYNNITHMFPVVLPSSSELIVLRIHVVLKDQYNVGELIGLYALKHFIGFFVVLVLL